MSRGVRVLRICGGGGGGGRQGWVVKHSLVHCMTVSGFPGLLLDASSILPLSPPPHTHTVVASKMSPFIATWPLGGKITGS